METPATPTKPPMHPGLTFTIVGAFIVAVVSGVLFIANRADHTADDTRVQSVYIGQAGGCSIYEVYDTVYDEYYMLAVGGTLTKNVSGRESKLRTIGDMRTHWQALKDARPAK